MVVHIRPSKPGRRSRTMPRRSMDHATTPSTTTSATYPPSLRGARGMTGAGEGVGSVPPPARSNDGFAGIVRDEFADDDEQAHDQDHGRDNPVVEHRHLPEQHEA